MSDPNSYALPTSTIPVYVLPPEQYTQQFGVGSPQGVPQPTSVQYVPVSYPPGAVQTFPQPIEAPGIYTQPPPQYAETVQRAPNNSLSPLEGSILARETLPSVCTCISAAFTLFGKHLLQYILWMVAFYCLFGGWIAFLALGNYRLIVPAEILFQLLLVPILGSLYHATLQACRSDNAEVTIHHFLYAFSPMICVQLLGVNLVAGLITAFGLLLLIAPGIYVAVCFAFSQLLFLEYGKHGISWSQSIWLSKSIISKNWCFWFGFLLVLGLLSCVPFLQPVALIALVLGFREAVGLIEEHDQGSFGMNNL